MIKKSSYSQPKFSVIILAGGSSTRMKSPKPWLKIDNTTFLEKIITTYQSFGITDIVVVINQKFCVEPWESNFQSITKIATIGQNKEVEKGRLYSIKLGLQKIIDADFVYIQNVDNPFIGNEVLEKLFQNRNKNGVTVPTFNKKGGHPILINSTIKEHILNNFDPSATLHNVINQFDRKNVEVENKSILININTPAAYKKALNELV